MVIKSRDWWWFILATLLVVGAWPDYVPKAAAIIGSFLAGAVFAFSIVDIRDRARALARD